MDLYRPNLRDLSEKWGGCHVREKAGELDGFEEISLMGRSPKIGPTCLYGNPNEWITPVDLRLGAGWGGSGDKNKGGAVGGTITYDM